jgi:cell wall-associated NlpC family hydrolase
MLDQVQRKNIKNFITQALETPFQDQGRDFSGWDCWGLIVAAYRQCFGLELPDLAGIPALNMAQVGKIFDTCRRSWIEIFRGSERPADVVLFRRGRWPCHVGLVVSPGHVLHVEPELDTCIEPFYRDPLQARLVGIYRHAEFTSPR